MMMLPVLLVMWPWLLLVSAHHRVPQFCELRDASNSIMEQKSCSPGRDCMGGSITAVIDGALVEYYYCRIANSPLSNAILTMYMRKKIMGYSCYREDADGRVLHDYPCPPGSECSRGPIMFDIPGEGLHTVKFCMIKDYKGELSWLTLF